MEKPGEKSILNSKRTVRYFGYIAGADCPLRREILILAIIILVGIFLRTWNFHDYLRFNTDQSRDAAVINNALSGNEPLPLLGPKAGGTVFRLGPVFYYFSYASGLFFGGEPDKLAYPDLFFSILAIPLFFFLSRIYFDKKISLALTLLFSVSFFVVRYSRFAWNPNSMPFFSMLLFFAFLKIADSGAKYKLGWAVAAGAALGIGVQLHSLFLFVMPVLAVLFFAYLFYKKNPAWKKIFYIAAIAVALNIPQIISEARTGGQNFRAFVVARDIKAEKTRSISENIVLDAACHIQANAFSVFSLGKDGDCTVVRDVRDIFQRKWVKIQGLAVVTFFSFLFSLTGYFLLGFYFKREDDPRKKIFLGLLAAYATLYFLFFIPVAREVSMRFFLILEFVPFLLLGFILKYINEKFSRYGVWLLAAIVILAVGLNLASLKEDFTIKKGLDPTISGIPDELTLFEMEAAARFIRENSGTEKTGYIEGKKNELFKYFRSLDYLSRKQGIDLIDLDATEVNPENNNIYTLKYLKKTERDEKKPVEISGYKVTSQENYARLTIYKLERL